MPTDVSFEMPTDVQEEIPAEMPEDVSFEMPDDIQEEIPADVTFEMPEDIQEEIPTEMPADVSFEMPTDVQEEIPAEMPEDVSFEMPDDIQEEIPAEMPEDVSFEMPEDIQKETPAEMPEDIQKEITAEMPEDVSFDMPEDVQEDISVDIPEEALIDIPEDVSIPEETMISESTEIPEEAMISDSMDIPEDTGISDFMNLTEEPESAGSEEFPGEPELNIPEAITDEPEMAISEDITEEIPTEPDLAMAEDITEEIPAEPEMAISEDITQEILSEPEVAISEDIPEDIPAEPEGSEEGIGDFIVEENDEDSMPEFDNNEDMDELLSSLLADMDESKKEEENAGPGEEPIAADDIEGLFNTAEALREPSDDENDIDLTSDTDLTNESDLTSETDLPSDNDLTSELDTGSDIDTTSEAISQDDIDSILNASGLDAPEEEQNGIEDIGLDLSAIGTDGIDLMPDSGEEEIGIGAVPGLSQEDESIDISRDTSVPVSEDIDALFSEIGDGQQQEYLSEDDLENAFNSQGSGDIGDLIKEIDSGEFEERIKNLNSDGEDSKKDKKKKKKSLFQRLFANVKEDLTPEQIKERQEKAQAEEEAKKKAAEDKKKKEALTKEQKEAKKAEDKAKAAEAAQKKAEEKKRKAAEAKEKARKKKEERLAIEEFEADEGKINKAGATILFIIFAAITIFIIVGTNIYSYNLSMKNAQEDFDEQLYNEAYYDIYGYTKEQIKSEHIDLHDKIMTVQYVNSELNSYEYYMFSNNKEKALDSLLKGLQRYDKYYALARELNINDDLLYVKEKILNKLETEFGLSESDAYSIIAIRDDLDYSTSLYKLIGDYGQDQ
ncbi:MAG: hypothetical protein IK071_00640, partial [Lachnospiraceae bacterium]|nr:hypothetical protein [Lachnospiraceae bacterium]